MRHDPVLAAFDEYVDDELHEDCEHSFEDGEYVDGCVFDNPLYDRDDESRDMWQMAEEERAEALMERLRGI